MFYSNDLLQRKTPLGCVWVMAHGKKLGKGRIMQVNVSETCSQIMDPGDVPHALRLQAILTSGIIIIHDRQSTFLLEDCHEALKRVNIEVSNLSAPTDVDLDPTKIPDITLQGDIDLLASTNLFPSFQTLDPLMLKKRKSTQINDDLFLMPSIPESTDNHPRGSYYQQQQSDTEHVQSLFANTTMYQHHEYHNQNNNNMMSSYAMMHDGGELMEVPDLPPGVFDMPALDTNEDYYNHIEHHMHTSPHQQQEQQHDEDDVHLIRGVDGVVPLTPAYQKQRKTGRKMKRPHIDTLDTITLPSSQYYYHYSGSQGMPSHSAMNTSDDDIENSGEVGVSQQRQRQAPLLKEHIIERPRRMLASSHGTKRFGGVTNPCMHGDVHYGPATGPWSEYFMKIWEESVNITLIGDGIGDQKKRKRSQVPRGDEDDNDEEERKKMNVFMNDENHDIYNYNGGYDIAPPDFDQHQQQEQQLGEDDNDNPFVGIQARDFYFNRRTSNEGSEGIETEKLRAALHGTPGNDYKSAMFQLGLTPASEDGGPFSGRKRFSNKFNRELRYSGRLSERSSDHGMESRRLPDLLEEFNDVNNDDALAALPMVGEHEDEAPSGISHFDLIEESAPSLPSAPVEMHTMHTMAVLASARSLTETDELSLFQATQGLTRLEAAQFFLHVLVGTTKKYIHADQDEPYGDITLYFAKKN